VGGVKTVAVISLLHESAGENSATRVFRGRAVLAWTLERLGRVEPRPQVAIACWADQRAAVAAAAGESGFVHLDCGERVFHIGVETVAAAQRWADGWRGGLLGTCWFDRGFHGPSVRAAVVEAGAEAAILIDPSAGLLDAEVTSGLLAHAASNADRALVFSQAAPGVTGVLLRRGLVEELEKLGTHPGRGLHYVPDHYAHDPIATPACAPSATVLCRTLERLTLDTRERVARWERATAGLNGELVRTGAVRLVGLLADAGVGVGGTRDCPRDVRIELTTRRATKAIFRPEPSPRGELTPRQWEAVLDQLAGTEARVMLGGLGDPLLYEGVEEVIAACGRRGIAVGVETDLVGIPEGRLERVAKLPLDVMLVYLPAAEEKTYAGVMGVMGGDGLAEAGRAVNRMIAARAPRGTPIFVPVFLKLRENAGEMEVWYDHYLRTCGAAVIEGAHSWAGAIADHGPVDMSPATRVACRRLWSRMSIRSDGTVGSCEIDQSPAGLGSVLESPVAEIWRGVGGGGGGGMGLVREGHVRGKLPVLCGACTEWHRP
jgi:hypothetical protein